jgi:hypothetical protein
MAAVRANQEISGRLRELLRDDIASRPFLCRGSPAGCEVILIGINPATETPFWDFWNENGCDKEAWLRRYLEIEGSYSPTRKRIEFIVDGLAPEVRALELNLYPYSSPREAKLDKELRDRRVFDYVLTLAEPKLMFVFGGSPTKELAAVLGCPLPFREYTRVIYGRKTFDVYVDNHLSYQWSDAAVKQLAQDFKIRVLADRNAGA